MRIICVLYIIVVNFILQSTVLQHFRVLGIGPNTSLIIVVMFAILWGKKGGATIGFCAGMLQDILAGPAIGINALIYMLVGYNMGIFEKTLFKDNYFTPVLFTMIATGFYHVLHFMIMYMLRSQIEMNILIRKIMLVEGIYNAVLSVFIYRLLYNFTKHPYIKVKTR